MLSPSLTNWRAQYGRMVRGYERLLTPYISSVEYNDDLQHFFQDCWHLKDWIKNDPQAGAARDAIEATVGACKPLCIVADLANACKHLDRVKSREGAYVTSAGVTVHLAQAKGIDLHYIVTLGDGSTLSAQDLVKDVFAAWHEVLGKLGLSP